MRRLTLPLVVVLVLAAAWAGGFGSGPADRPTNTGDGAAPTALPEWLPKEAADTLARIRTNGPHPYRKDGSTFRNREGRLPAQPRGYYREYTVPTPGEDDRGARRIVSGGDPPDVFYYTGDHYRSFRRIEGYP